MIFTTIVSHGVFRIIATYVYLPIIHTATCFQYRVVLFHHLNDDGEAIRLSYEEIGPKGPNIGTADSTMIEPSK